MKKKLFYFYIITFIYLFIAFRVQVMISLSAGKSLTQLLIDQFGCLSQDLRVFFLRYLATTTQNVFYVKVQV